MKRFDIGQTINTFANIGVLIGLILVAVQINQSTGIAEAQLTNDYYLADMELELSMMGDAPVDSFVRAVYDPDQIDQRDAAVLDRYFNYGLVQLNRLIRMRELGFADDRSVQQQVNYMTWHLGNEAGRRWWAAYRGAGRREVVRLVDAALESSKNDFRQNQLQLDAVLPERLE